MLTIACFAGAALLRTSEGQAPPTEINPPDVPADVSIPSGFPGNPIDFFDDFSWRSLIALVWPALQGQRGMPDTQRPLTDTSSPLVFETLKNDWEVFLAGGLPPVGGGSANDPELAWQSYDTVIPRTVDLKAGFGGMVFAPPSFSKFGNLGQAGFGNLVGPLIAQNRTYVRYLTGFNRKEFVQIYQDKLYLDENLTNVTFANTALDVKTAWMEMKGVAHPERYHKRTALLFDPASETYQTALMGLIGFHIVQKTKSRPQWIWSSFEQVDNVPPGHGPFALNNGNGPAMPNNNPVPFPPPETPPAPFNVDRQTPIHGNTVATNARYQQALKDKGSVWQFYQLVMTQWPVSIPADQDVPASKPGTPNNTFPGAGATTSFANVALETFDQKSIQKGCMNCHNFTRINGDFLWSLKVNAFKKPAPPQPLGAAPAGGIKDESLKQLKALLEQQ